ncbi:MAG: hypothetical protein ACYDCC_02615 [Actinomycetota bacterium]
MKKIFGFVAISMLALGSFGVAHAAPPPAQGSCSGPVDVDCTILNADGTTTQCLVYVDLDSAGGPDAADGCTLFPSAP